MARWPGHMGQRVRPAAASAQALLAGEGPMALDAPLPAQAENKAQPLAAICLRSSSSSSPGSHSSV